MSRSETPNGIRVVELGTSDAVAFAARMLTQMGAEVVKVDLESSSGAVTVSDYWHLADVGRDAYLHTGKRRHRVDLDAAASQTEVERLLGWTQIVLLDDVVTLLPQVQAALSADSVRVVRIYLTPHGVTQDAAATSRPSAPVTVYVEAGEASLIAGGSPEEEPPMTVSADVLNFNAGAIAALASLAAVYPQVGEDDPVESNVTIDLAVRETETSIHHWISSHYFRSGWIESRASQKQPIGGIVPCQDGYACVLPSTQNQWDGLKEVMGNPAWASDDRLSTREGRFNSGPFIQQHLTEWTRTKTKAELLDLGLSRSLPIGVVRDAPDLLACPQFAHRGFLETVETDAGPVTMPTIPWTSPAPHSRASTTLTRHGTN